MNTLAHIPYDFYDFLEKDMREPLTEVLEPMVKRGSTQLPDLENLSELEDSKYALILKDNNGLKMRKLAHHTPELCEVNAAIFEKVAKYLPAPIVKVAANNIQQAAQDWGVQLGDFYKEGQVTEFVDNEVDISRLNTVKPHNSPFLKDSNVDHILTKEAAERIKNPFARQDAIQYLHKHAHQMDVKERIVFSQKLWDEMSKASESNSFIEKRASLDTNTLSPDLKSYMNKRLEWVQGERDHEEVYAAIWEKKASYSPVEFCEMLEAADRKTGVAKHWGALISYPEEVLNPLTKEASYREISQLDKELVADVVGVQTANALFSEEGEAVWRSLPQPTKQDLLELV